MAQGEFLKKVQEELSSEEIEGLRAYQATADRGSLVIMPIIKGMGREVNWRAFVYVKGAAGPIPNSKASLRAIGAPDDWADKSKAFVDTLQREYPALSPGFPEQRPTS